MTHTTTRKEGTMSSTVRIHLTHRSVHGVDFAGWPTKREAAAALTALRDTGRNTDRCVEIHPVVGHLGFRWWVIARPDPLHEFTWLMRADGAWHRGRLYDEPPTGGGALWVHVPASDGQPIPATITHDYRYTAGWQEVAEAGERGCDLLGRPVQPRSDWFATAWCVACTWTTTDTDESAVRAAACGHRANPGSLPLRTDVGRLLGGQVLPGSRPSPERW